MPWSRPAKAAALLTPLIAAWVAYDRMSFAAFRAKNAGASFPGKAAVVVGGTSGIGMGVAKRLAQADFDVTIVGRNAAAANEILAEMKAAGKGRHSFIQCDAELVGNIGPCTRQWTSAAGSTSAPLDVLVLTQGIASMAGRTETPEGLDRKMALHHYSRQGFIEALLPNLRAAAARAAGTAGSGEGAGKPWAGPKVLSVLSGGIHSPYAHYATDPELKEHYSLKNAADAAGLYNDLCMDARSREEANGGIAFMHAAPGAVQTNWGSEFPLPLKLLVRGVQMLMPGPEDCAEVMLAPVFDPSVKGGFHLYGSSTGISVLGGGADKKTSVHEEALPVVWRHTKEVLDRLMK